MKSKSGLTAACEVVSGMEIAEGKTKKRYPKFSKLVKVQKAEKPVEETEKTDEVKQPIEIEQVQNVEKPIEQKEVQMAASVETENNLFDDDFDFDDIE